jgi:hypothetical protein
VMTFESLRAPMQHGHLVGDVPALLVVAIVLGLLMSRGQTSVRRDDDSEQKWQSGASA